MRLLKIFSLVIVISACSTNNFYKRHYLKGIYKDKIETIYKADNIDYSQNTYELTEYPISAEKKSNEVFVPTTIQQVLINRKELSLNIDTNKIDTLKKVNNLFKNFESDSTEIDESKFKNINKENAQSTFNYTLKQAGVRLTIFYLFRAFLSVISLIVLFNLSIATASATSIFLLLISFFLGILFSTLFLYKTLDLLVFADRIRVKYNWLKNQGWYYFLLGLCILFIFTTLYWLMIMGVYWSFNIVDAFF
ncbi:MAG: hypothetical protein ACK4IK_02900 [Bacteroidia bacterium]